MTSWTWASYPDMEPVESTQKQTSINPNEGICLSIELDFANFATLPTLLALLPVRTTGLAAGSGMKLPMTPMGAIGIETGTVGLAGVTVFGWRAEEVCFLISLVFGLSFFLVSLYYFLFFVLSPETRLPAISFIVLVPTVFLIRILVLLSTKSLPSSIVLSATVSLWTVFLVLFTFLAIFSFMYL